MRAQIFAIARKELNSYFNSLLALIFLGLFLGAVLFIFFTVDTFFARGVADVRPLFNRMPWLLIFLLAALTMRQWSEEKRSGTEELLLTLPVRPVALVLGKFLAVLAMIGLALALTLPLPLSVAFLGRLDWGPVIGGYLAAILMAAAYAAIGLFVSSRTDNQLVALIVTAIVGGALYLVGTRFVTDFVGGATSEILWALGTGSRFESIERGVVDVRDLVYYLSLTGIFLTLNVISLDMVRWSRAQLAYRRRAWLTVGLLCGNLLLINVWLSPLNRLRLDMTAQREYTLSDTTRDLFVSVQEPLLLRAYISEQNHPLLQPLRQPVADMLREYEIASDGRLTVEVVDPLSDPELEAEANQTYGIRPQPFQVSGRNESSVINAYFDILVRYGDQNVVLNFADLIEVDSAPTTGDLSVRLRNLEYDLTSAIKRVVFGFQSVDAVLAALDEPVTLTFYATPITWPAELASAEDTVAAVAGEIEAGSDGKFTYEYVNLDDPASPVGRDFLRDTYGVEPFALSLFSNETFYAHMILQNGDDLQLIYLPAQVTEAEVRNAIEATLKRSTTGFLKNVGVVAPQPTQPAQGAPIELNGYAQVQDVLSVEYTVQPVDLSTGSVPGNIDILLVIAPANLTEAQLFAIDQYLMRGGAVIMAVSPYQLTVDSFTGTLRMLPANVQNVIAWLAANNIVLEQQLVLDPQNAAFPISTVRDAGGFQVQEISAVEYPLFVDVRSDGMDDDSPILSSLPAVVMSWASPLAVVTPAAEGGEATVLLRSTDGSWSTTSSAVQPDFTTFPQYGFPPGTDTQSYSLAISAQGPFASGFAGRTEPPEGATAGQVIEQSPDTSRLVVIGSSMFVEDNALQLLSALEPNLPANNLQFMQNAVDWAVADLDLLSIRSRGSAARVLAPLTDGAARAWEIGNYLVALVLLLAVYSGVRWRIVHEPPLVLRRPAADRASAVESVDDVEKE